MTIPMPVQISDVSMVFPADALDYMPRFEDIPDDFKNGTTNPWVRFQSDWFSSGLEDIQFITKEVDGEKVDPEMVWRQLRAIQGSYAPPHEHKMATVGYLASLWMESLYYKPKDRDPVALGEHSIEEWQAYFDEQEQA